MITRRSLAWGLAPQIAIVLGIYVLHNVLVALALEIAILGCLLCLSLFQGWRPRLGGLSKKTLYFLPTHLCAGLVVYLLLRNHPETLHSAFSSLAIDSSSLPLLTIIHCLVVPVFEELFWRQLLVSSSPGIAVPDLLFALYHAGTLAFLFPLYLAVLSLFVLAGTAWLWRRLVLEEGGLAPSLLLHASADLSLFVAAWFLL